jgi:sensor c-di-GMP phosphodiesterase-like protein
VKTKKITTRGLRKALMSGNIIPWYQPVVSAQGKVAGVEVLARWICKDGTHISPEVFIPAAILSGDIALVTQVLMKRAAVDLAQYAEWLPHPFHVAFNIPATVLSGQHFLTDCQNFQAAFSPGTIQIMIEVTERDTAEDLFQVAARLNQLILDGVNVVLDDFGTGYAI